MPFTLMAGLTIGICARAAEPLRLDQLVGIALTNNPDAVLAEHRIRAANAIIMQADSAIWPKAQLQSSYTRTDNPLGVFGAALSQHQFSPTLNFNDVPEADNLNVRGAVSVPLYTGGRISAGRDAARANSTASRRDADAVRNQLAFEVTRAFHTVGKTREFIRAAEAAVHAFEENLVIARKRLNAGSALKTEVLDLEVRLAQSREDVSRARNARSLTLRALANLIGQESGELEVAEQSNEVAAPAENVSPNRAELDAFAARERAAEAAVRNARAGNRPRVSAFASVDQDHGWKFNGSGTSFGGGLMAQWDLWDGKLTQGRVSQAQAELDAVREEQRRLRLAIYLETEQARLNLREADERLTVTGKAVKLASESVTLTRARFEQGLSLATQLIDAETALTGARVRYAEAQADRRIAISALRKALGLPQLEEKTEK